MFSSTTGFLRGGPVGAAPQTQRPTARQARLAVEAKYRGRGTDLSKVAQFQRHDSDTGSTEVQIARLSARITQLTGHLKEHRKDFATRRGLEKLLSQRRHFMQYLYNTDRSKYEAIIGDLAIRPLRIQAGRGVVVKATEEGLELDEAASVAASDPSAQLAE